MEIVKLKAFCWMNFSGTIACDWSEFLNQTTDGYYFYRTYYSFDTMQSFSCQFIIFIFVFFSLFSGVFICLLVCLLASLYFFARLLFFRYFFTLILNSWWMPSFRFGSPICTNQQKDRITYTQLCWLYALKFLVDWTVHTHTIHMQRT